MPQPAHPAPLRARTRHQQRPAISPRTTQRRNHHDQREQRQQQAERRRLRVQKQNQVGKVACAPQIQRSSQNAPSHRAQAQRSKAQNQQNQQNRGRVPKVDVPLRQPRLNRRQMRASPSRLGGRVSIHTAGSPPRNRGPYQRARTHQQGAHQLPRVAHKGRTDTHNAARPSPTRKPPQARNRTQRNTHRAGKTCQGRNRHQPAVTPLHEAQ